jgi:hypothetical protein
MPTLWGCRSGALSARRMLTAATKFRLVTRLLTVLATVLAVGTVLRDHTPAAGVCAFRCASHRRVTSRSLYNPQLGSTSLRSWLALSRQQRIGLGKEPACGKLSGTRKGTGPDCGCARQGLPRTRDGRSEFVSGCPPIRVCGRWAAQATHGVGTDFTLTDYHGIQAKADEQETCGLPHTARRRRSIGCSKICSSA